MIPNVMKPVLNNSNEVKELLRDAIVVGHKIKSDERALCFDIGSVAHCVYDSDQCQIE